MPKQESNSVALSRAITRRIHRLRERYGYLRVTFCGNPDHIGVPLMPDSKLRTRVYISEGVEKLAISHGNGPSTLMDFNSLQRVEIKTLEGQLVLNYQRGKDGIFVAHK